MDSYGEILKKAREEKKLDIVTAARETSISEAFIKGLENEDLGAFPGEAYMLGFMRNYAEFLNVSPECVSNLYRAKKLQESPVPEGLIVHEKPWFFWPVIFTSSAFFLVAVFVVLYIFVFNKKTDEMSEVVVDKNVTTKKYELTDKVFSGRLYTGDKIIYPSKNGKIVLTVNDTLSSFGLQCPVGTLYTDLAEEADLDIDGDTMSDMIVYVSDISSTDSSRGAEVRIVKRGEGVYITTGVTDTAEIPFASELGTQKRIVILEDNRAYPFTLNGSFRGSCEFRYKVDRHDAVEGYFASGEVVTMTANNGIRIWMSNYNTVKFSITADSKGYDLEIGKAGQVLVEDIKWIKDTDGKYKLVVIELD